jgi:hypothetical protein
VPNVGGTRKPSPVGPEDRQLYSGVLNEIAARLRMAKELLEAENASLANIELAALHLRKVVELIVMGSLVTNRTEIEGIAKALRSKKVKEARTLAERANPEYWPKGASGAASEDGTVKVEPVEGAMTEDEWDSVYGHLSELLHARNPYKPPIDVERELAWLTVTLNKILKLLEHHIVVLVDREHLMMGRLLFDQGQVEVITLVRP